MDSIKVRGTAIRAGLSKNGIMYISEELKATAHELAGKPILKDHVPMTDNTVGRTTHSFFVESDDRLDYEGWIKEDGTGIVERVKDGRINTVSIGAFCEKLVKESEDSENLCAIGIHYMELSTTPSPGVTGTSMIAAEAAPELIVESFGSNSNPQDNAVEEQQEKVKRDMAENTDAVKQLEEATRKLAEAEKQLAEKSKVVSEMEAKKKTELVSEILKLNPALKATMFEGMSEQKISEMRDALAQSNTQFKSAPIVETQEKKEVSGVHAGYEQGVAEYWVDPKYNVTEFLTKFGGRM